MAEETQKQPNEVRNIMRLEAAIDNFLQTHPVTPSELVGFFELKLVEFKENFRSNVAAAIAKAQQEANDARRQGKKAS